MKKGYIIRCYPGPGKARCGTGNVLLRLSHEKAVVAARTHAMRKGHTTKVFPVRLQATFVARPEQNREYVVPNPRQVDDRIDGYWG